MLVVVLGPFGLKLPDETNEEFLLPAASQSVQASEMLRERFPGGDLRPVLLVYRREGGLTDGRPGARSRPTRAGRREVPLATTPLAAVRAGRAAPGQVSADGEVAFTVVPLTAEEPFRVDAVDRGAARDRDERRRARASTSPARPRFASDFDSAVKEADASSCSRPGCSCSCCCSPSTAR